ncbi:MAG: matrixin family metalloprotease [Deltaproteobacteria bacterium]|nr:matrixin family metalloprotease [Deltaproteobacteria bacterium]
MRAELRPLLFALAASTALVLPALPATAHAFCRTTTIPPPPDFTPQGGACFTQGELLFHPSQCVTYKVATASAGAISTRMVADAFARAFATWTAPSSQCLPGVTAVQTGSVEGPVVVAYDASAPASNANVVGFVAGAWPHATTGETLALTTVTFVATDGRILDADTEIRRDVSWASGAALGPDTYDFDTAILHEAGHFLGLAHSEKSTAAMFASYTPGTARTKLDDDDARGICAIYPSREARGTKTGEVAASVCQVTPSASDAAAGCDPTIVHGCAMTRSSATPDRSSSPWWAAAVAIGAIAAGWLRARRRHEA